MWAPAGGYAGQRARGARGKGAGEKIVERYTSNAGIWRGVPLWTSVGLHFESCGIIHPTLEVITAEAQKDTEGAVWLFALILWRSV
jgi:hypothetical protein